MNALGKDRKRILFFSMDCHQLGVFVLRAMLLVAIPLLYSEFEYEVRSISVEGTVSKGEEDGGGDINSSTGKRFGGDRMRSFGGKLLDFQFTGTSNVLPRFFPMNKCTKWGVLTTIFEPTIAVKRVADMPSWCIVVIADTKTPGNYVNLLAKVREKNVNTTVTKESLRTTNDSLDNVFFFSVEKQKEWEQTDGPLGEFTRNLPWKHFSRKNLGFLFSILHGAEVVFDFDDDNYIKLDAKNGKPMNIFPETNVDNGKRTLFNVSVVSIGIHAFNHHIIMHPSIIVNETSWARGFPLDLIRNKNTHGRIAYQTDVHLKSRTEEIGVIQYLADGDPDIDAIHRLSKPLPMTFNFGEAAHPVIVPKHAYAPYNAQATIHTKNALWATLLPATVPGRVSDIWRSFLAQCIFADAGLRLVFAPPKISQKRNYHNYLADFEAEQDLFTKSGKLLEFLMKWDTAADSIPKRVERLWIDLYERGYIEHEDVLSVQLWFAALYQIGYKFPSLRRRFRNVAVMGQFNYADSPSIINDVIFWSQKYREYFDTTIAAGPFSDDQVRILSAHSVRAIQSSDHTKGTRGHYQPHENLGKALLMFQNSSSIQAVLYAHDDALVNVTELSQECYPFPTHQIIGNTKLMGKDEFSYADPRAINDSTYNALQDIANKVSYRMYPNGTCSNLDKTKFFDSFAELYHGQPLMPWNEYLRKRCAGGQQKLAMDSFANKYREDDTSIIFPSYTQADFLFVPTKFAEAYADAHQLIKTHGIWLECGLPSIVQMIRTQSKDVDVRIVQLCTNWSRHRGKASMIKWCKAHSTTARQEFGVLHPVKLSGQHYFQYSNMMDAIQ